MRALSIAILLATMFAASAWADDGGQQRSLAPDGAGGVYVARLVPFGGSNRLVLEHFRGDGTRAPGYAVPQALDTTGGISGYAIAPDGFGGAVAAFGSPIHAGVPSGVFATRASAAVAPTPGWPRDGVLALDGSLAPTTPGVARDGAGGLFTTRTDYGANTNDLDINGQRIGSAATIAPGWPDSGVAICACPGDQFDPVMVPDELGGAFVAWSDGRAYGTALGYDIWAQHVNADGSLAWDALGVPVARDSFIEDYFPVGTPDGFGGVLVAWLRLSQVSIPECPADELGLQRVNSAGTRVTGWPERGVALGHMVSGPLAGPIADGAGGAWVFASVLEQCSMTSPAPRAARLFHVASDGHMAPGFTEQGKVLSTDTRGGPLATALVADAPLSGGAVHGVIAVWATETAATSRPVRAMRILPSGVSAPEWPSDGAVVVDHASETVGAITDGAGGALVVWIDSDEVTRVTRVTRDGVVRPDWPGAPFSTVVSAARPYPSSGAVTIPLALPRVGPLEARVLDLQGRLVRKLANVAQFSAGQHDLTWDGRDDDGRDVTNGLYFVSVRWNNTTHGVRVAIVR